MTIYYPDKEFDFNEFKPKGAAVVIYDLIKAAGKGDMLTYVLDSIGPPRMTEDEINIYLWEKQDEIFEELGIEKENDESLNQYESYFDFCHLACGECPFYRYYSQYAEFDCMTYFEALKHRQSNNKKGKE